MQGGMSVSDQDTALQPDDFGTVICPECGDEMAHLSDGVYCEKCEDYWEAIPADMDKCK